MECPMTNIPDRRLTQMYLQLQQVVAGFRSNSRLLYEVLPLHGHRDLVATKTT